MVSIVRITVSKKKSQRDYYPAQVLKSAQNYFNRKKLSKSTWPKPMTNQSREMDLIVTLGKYFKIHLIRSRNFNPSFRIFYSGKFLPNVYRLKKHHDAHHRQIKCKVCGEYYPGNLFTKSSRELNEYSIHCLRFLENECFRLHWRVCRPRIS